MLSTRSTLKKALVVLGVVCMSQSASAEDNSVFYELTSSNGVVSYLFGTMHTDDNRVTDFTETVLNAVESSDVFMLETDQPKSSDPMLAKAKLSDDLTVAEMDQVNALADEFVMSRTLVNQMKPWLLAVMYASPKPQTPFGQDNLLKSEAKKWHKEIVPFATAAAHFGVMDDIPREEQLALLKAVLKRSQADKEADYEKVMKAYLSGDMDAILAVNAQTTGSLVSDALWQKLYQRLVVQRNQTMAQKLIARAKAQSIFVAVGASHLAGETGLIQQLKQTGFRLKPLTGIHNP